jgi:hypothetical protein
MNKSQLNRSRQQTLRLEHDELRQRLSESDREKCKTLLAQMLTEVIQLSIGQENDDE